MSLIYQMNEYTNLMIHWLTILAVYQLLKFTNEIHCLKTVCRSTTNVRQNKFKGNQNITKSGFFPSMAYGHLLKHKKSVQYRIFIELEYH